MTLKMSFLPVVIGSYALKEHGLVQSFNDKDLIVDNASGGALALACDKKTGNSLFFGEIVVDLQFLNTKSNELLFTACNQNSEKYNCKKIVITGIGEVLLPPLELLYVVLKSHIHRILPVTQLQNENIKIWQKHLRYYKLVRDKLGYEKMDNILYKSYLGEWREITNDASLEDLMRQVFQQRFNETNQRVGDTTVSMEQSKEAFFKDNVERFINHDELHKRVSMVFRQDPEPIFKKYQTNPNQVDLDLELFLKTSYQEKIDMLREELMVLFLERKWIPEVKKCYVDMKIPYNNFDRQIKNGEFLDIGVNFITNLCGQGDYWLRRFCLDHVHVLLDYNKYDFDKLKDLALEISGYTGKLNAIKDTGIMKYVDNYKADNSNFIYYAMRDGSFRGGYTSHSFFGGYWGQGVFTVQYMDINDFHVENRSGDPYWSKKVSLISKIHFGSNTDKTVLELLQKYFSNGYQEKKDWSSDSSVSILGAYINSKSFTLYNLNKNIGIRYDKQHFTIFTMIFSSHNRQFETIGHFVDIFEDNIQNFEENHVVQYKEVHYNSTESCERRGPDPSYVSGYGSAPFYVIPFIEFFAKKHLHADDQYDKVTYENKNSESSEEEVSEKSEESDKSDSDDYWH